MVDVFIHGFPVGLCLWLIGRARRWRVDSIDQILPWLTQSKERLVKYVAEGLFQAFDWSKRSI
jgi:hypothetical protein